MASMRRIGAWKAAAIGIALAGAPAAGSVTDGGLRCVEHDVIGTMNPRQGVKPIMLVGDLVYALTRDDGFFVVDVSNPATPEVLSSIDTYASFQFDVEGTLAAVCDSSLVLVDIGSPDTITEQTRQWLGSPIGDVDLVGDLAFVAAGDEGLQILDVSDPRAPAVLGSLPFTNATLRITVRDGIAFVSDDQWVLHAIDVTDPENPADLGSLYASPSFINEIECVGDLLYLPTSVGGLRILDVSDMANPSLVNVVDGDPYTLDVSIDGDRLYVASGERSVRVFDMTDPIAPAFIGRVHSTHEAYGVAGDGSILFVGDLGEGVQALDARSPGSSPLLSQFGEEFDHALGVFWQGDVLFVAVEDDGMIIVDVADPAAPAVVGTFSGNFQVRDVVVEGSIAYVVSNRGLYLVNVADPANPVELGRYAPCDGRNVVVRGPNAFMACRRDGIVILDVSDPTDPKLISLDDPGDADSWDLDLQGDLLYVAQGNRGLDIYDVSDLVVPVRVNRVEAPETIYEIDVDGAFAYLGMFGGGLDIMSLANPIAPTVVGSVFVPHSVGDVAVDGTVVHAATSRGYWTFDVSDPSAPVITGRLELPTAVDVHVSGDRVAVAASDDGVLIVDASDCPVCVADADANGAINLDDLDAFVLYFLGGDLIVDFDHNGVLNFDDIDAFVAGFLAGCG